MGIEVKFSRNSLEREKKGKNFRGGIKLFKRDRPMSNQRHIINLVTRSFVNAGK